MKAKTAWRSSRRDARPSNEPFDWPKNECGAETTPQASFKKTGIPTDRDKVWPGVLQRRGRDGGLTEVDEATLVGQLGYLVPPGERYMCRGSFETGSIAT